jgi:hypothetical protein
MSQSGITDTARESDWDRWYVDHLRIMVTVPGVTSAQRFKTASPDYPPSLALYSIASPDVFSDPYYQSIRGMGEWLQLIDRRYYHRNLFEGLDRAPPVGDDEVLLIADREHPEPDLAHVAWSWLECVGIDRSTPYRGFAIVDSTLAQRASASKGTSAGGIAVYMPVTACVQPK